MGWYGTEENEGNCSRATLLHSRLPSSPAAPPAIGFLEQRKMPSSHLGMRRTAQTELI